MDEKATKRTGGRKASSRAPSLNASSFVSSVQCSVASLAQGIKSKEESAMQDSRQGISKRGATWYRGNTACSARPTAEGAETSGKVLEDVDNL